MSDFFSGLVSAAAGYLFGPAAGQIASGALTDESPGSQNNATGNMSWASEDAAALAAQPYNGSTSAGPTPESPGSSFNPSSLVQPGINAIGALAGAGLSAYGTQQTNAANAQQAQAQMDFQERMSSTAYQRATTDMKAAGLNPMLAYSQGGASSPAGSQATMQNVLGGGVASALSALTTLIGADNMTKQGDVIDAQAANIKSETALNALRGDLIPAQTQGTIASAGQTAAATQNIKEDLLGVRHRARSAMAHANVDVESQDERAERIKLDVQYQRLRNKLAGLGINEASSYSDFYGSAAGKSKPFTDYGLNSANKAKDLINPIKGIFGNSAKSLQRREPIWAPGYREDAIYP